MLLTCAIGFGLLMATASATPVHVVKAEGTIIEALNSKTLLQSIPISSHDHGNKAAALSSGMQGSAMNVAGRHPRRHLGESAAAPGPNSEKLVTRGISEYTIDTALGMIKNNPEIYNLISSNPNLTIFIPSDQAFANFNFSRKVYYNFVYSNQAALVRFIKYHILPSAFFASPKSNTRVFLRAISGERIRIDTNAGDIRPGSGFGETANVIGGIKVSNGVIYIIDNVLIPPRRFSNLAQWSGLTSFLNLARKVPKLVGAVDNLSNITIFAPTNTAISALRFLEPNLNIQASMGILSTIVDQHLAKGPLFSTLLAVPGVQNSTVITTGLPGQNLTVLNIGGTTIEIISKGGSMVAIISSTDYLIFKDSVLHVIDVVLLPSANAIAAATLNPRPVFPRF